MNIVIGSGPAGIACIHALLEKGEEVLVIDAGFQLEKEQRDLLARLIQDEDAGALARLKALELSDAGLPMKLSYGSDFPYRGAEENLGFTGSDRGLIPSLAAGGLSNVWGAAVLPYRQGDIQDWPISTQDLDEHYKKILKITGIAAKKDDLEELFPIYAEILNDLRPSGQARELLAGLRSLQQELKEDGIFYGSSRLMVGPSKHNSHPCVYCAQCIYGCPYGCIYNSGDDLMSLLKKRQPGLHYRSDIIVTTIKESGATVTVSGFDRLSREPVTLEAQRAFLAAGVIPSTKIMLNSLDIHDHPVEVKDSQYFLFPLLSLKGHQEAVTEAAYTLSQLFVEIQDETISPNIVHLQIYSYNDFITKTLERKFWFLPFLRGPIIRFLQHRLFIVQGFLHSRHSGKIELTLTQYPDGKKDRIVAKAQVNPEARQVIGKVLQKLGKHFRKLGLFPIASALEFCLPGRGFHSGGSFPMSAQPGPLESDIYGRINGASRIHVVDASIFPSIPATTITLTAMANAHRIGSANY